MPNVRIKLDYDVLDRISRHVESAAWEAMEALRGEVKNAQVIPKRNGELEKSMAQTEQFVVDDELHTALVTGGGDVPYARRLYFHPEYNFHYGKNQNAQGEWLKPWLPGGDLEGYLPENFTKRLKSKISE